MDGNLASIYTLIHAFLTKHSHSKAAQAVKKAAKEVVILKDDIDLEGPQLDEIIAQWKLLKASSQKASTDSSTSESDSESSTSSSSSSHCQTKKVKAKGTQKKASPLSEESESGSSESNTSKSDPSESDSDSSSDSDSERPVNTPVVIKSKLPVPLAKSNLSESSSSSSSDSDSDLKKPIKAPVVSKSKISVPLVKSNSSKSSSSSSSDSDSDSDLKKPIKAPVVPKSKTSVPLAKSTSSESSSSSNSSSESDDESSDPESSEQIENVEKEVKLQVNIDKRPKVERDSSRTLSSENTSSPNPGSNDGNDKESLVSPKRESSASTDPSREAGTPKAQVEQVQVTKKRRTDRDGTAVATATTLTVRQEATGPMSTGRIKGYAKHGRQVNERFRRVDPSKMEPVADNRYVAKVAPTNDYGQRAHEDLIVTRGQGFRKEKNKKKKGSYRGGEITMESHSFKFA